MAMNAVLFVAITCRMISAGALISAVPDLADRGAFMSVNASLQQFSGGLASSLAGLIVVQVADGRLVHYDLLGYVVVGAMALTIGLMYPIHRAVMRKPPTAGRGRRRPPRQPWRRSDSPIGQRHPAGRPDAFAQLQPICFESKPTSSIHISPAEFPAWNRW